MAIVVYLQPSEYATFGVPSDIDTSAILRASLIIDGFLDRRDGLLYTEVSGSPAYMTKTGSPIQEIYDVPISRHLTLSYTPLQNVISVKQNIAFCWGSPYIGSPPNFQNCPFTFQAGYSDLWLQATARTRAIVLYIGGWTYENLPSEIKMACANIANMINEQIISGSVVKYQAGDTAITFGINQNSDETLFIDQDTVKMLTPWRRTFR